MTRRFLSHARIDSFGAFSNRTIGPFSPGLNVVFGRNEAGKTTLASFLSGVLFGWEEARGKRNTYKPAASERAGALFFAAREDAGTEAFGKVCDTVQAVGADDGAHGAHSRSTAESGVTDRVTDRENDTLAPRLKELVLPEVELSRVRNADGLSGDASIVDDIDKETFRTMFFLTSDELRSLRNTSDMTARLLTAGSGTGASPAHVLATINERIAARTSRSAGASESLVNLSAEMDELRTRIAEAEREAERFKRQSIEQAELAPQLAEMADRIATVNDEVDALTAAQAAAARIDDQIADLEAERAEVRERARADGDALSDDDAATSKGARLDAGFPRFADDAGDERLVRLTSSEERSLRDTIDALADDQAKHDHIVEVARGDYGTSKARYEALIESEDADERARNASRQRAAQMAFSVALPIVFVVAGILLFMHGRTIGSPSYSILGGALVVGAVVLAGASLLLMFRPNKSDEEWEARKQDLRWTMLQDKKRYEQVVQDADRAAAEAQAYLESVGLGAADGSLRRARQLLDEAAAKRGQIQAADQRRKAREVRLAAIDDAIASARDQRAKLCIEAGIDADASMLAIERALDRKTRQRDELIEANGRTERRFGELTSELSQARKVHEFDELKLRYQQVRTRFNESTVELARLLVARRMVESAVNAWESKSQPEVYRQASRLLSLMTGGRWVKVEMTPEGKLLATDAVKASLDPSRLSLSTCQQLYLSLRIALLITADNVGRSVPIIADDILVNFDAKRRAAAARALAELARNRQVILLTCHEEVVSVLREADASTRVIEL